MCDSDYEYEPHGIFGTGSGQALTHVEGDEPRPAGLLQAFERGNQKDAPKFVRVQRQANVKRST